MLETNPILQIPSSLWQSCPKCSAQMLLTRSEPERPGFDRLGYECPRCGHTDTKTFKML